MADRVAALRDAVDAVRDRGYPVWIGGTDPAVREVAAAHADGWNRWGGGLERFREQGANLQAAAARSPFTLSWGGLVVLADDDDAAAAKAERLGAGDQVLVGGPDLVAAALRAYVDAGAEWLMIGPGRFLGSRQRADPGRGDSAPVALRAAGTVSAMETQRRSACERAAASRVSRIAVSEPSCRMSGTTKRSRP